MPVANYVFTETSPSSAGTVASSNLVSGGIDNGIPNGVCGLIGDYDSCQVSAELVGATGGTLNVYLQSSPDEGANWYDVIAWPQLASGASAVIYKSPLSNATMTTTTTVVGKNLSPALNPGSTGAVVNGALTDRCRLVMVAGAGTSAGASVVVRLSAQRARLRETGD